ncbi:ABC transporter substrate-binding protein [Thalassococcus sp. CAU 1522]|uniref:ABC transporter substrate-binding protein n=1 Tax=Thalassococcus arenae TaxID=2851652 RepID=A0ABS6NB17_9RHOB|nr:ABC transporter substrate-binding protein [Thalassococcus arenae]MBV2360872.1 ABC transporter substrate-binding protein [Thalassococcus arenae]
MKTLLAALSVLVGLSAAAASAVEVSMHYLRLEVEPPPTLSNLDPIPEDLGLAGALLAVDDNATTGRFLGQSHTLAVTSVAPGGDLLAAARAALGESRLLVLDAPAATQQAIADLPEAAGALLFNTSAAETDLRDTGCRANLLHTLPSRAMLADALMQFLVARRWTALALVRGQSPGDAAFAEALDRSATKFGLKIGAAKVWAFDADMRRNAAQEVPLFTQDLGRHDVLLVADEANDFARYIAYNTWEPRPVAGSEGLMPVAWDRVVEQWGAAQLQSRFVKANARAMQSRDYAAWAAVRAIGEAVTRTGSADPATLRAFLLGPDFELAGFKGRPMTFRPWNGQLRQPIPLVTGSALVAQAPLEGFLHQVNEQDTLGVDAPESRCEAFTP